MHGIFCFLNGRDAHVGRYSSVAALSLYKNVTDAKLASCIAARNLAKHRRFYKGSLRNIPSCHPLCQYSVYWNPKIAFCDYILKM